MKLFFDTSALVKYFHNEQGSQEVIELIENPDNDIEKMLINIDCGLWMLYTLPALHYLLKIIGRS